MKLFAVAYRRSTWMLESTDRKSSSTESEVALTAGRGADGGGDEEALPGSRNSLTHAAPETWTRSQPDGALDPKTWIAMPRWTRARLEPRPQIPPTKTG